MAGLRTPCVYILASQRNGTIYIGVTSNLVQRVWQHRDGASEGFTSRFGVKTLVYFEQHETMDAAVLRERQIKKWNRAWELRLIEQDNPTWRDLYPDIAESEPPPGCPPSRA